MVEGECINSTIHARPERIPARASPLESGDVSGRHVPRMQERTAHDEVAALGRKRSGTAIQTSLAKPIPPALIAFIAALHRRGVAGQGAPRPEWHKPQQTENEHEERTEGSHPVRQKESHDNTSPKRN